MSYPCLIIRHEFKYKNAKLFLSLTANSMGAEEFGYAIERVWELPESPDNMEKLELYK